MNEIAEIIENYGTGPSRMIREGVQQLEGNLTVYFMNKEGARTSFRYLADRE